MHNSPENYPEEYLTGKVIFFGHEFTITPDVLIPRLETEGLVRRARESIENENFDIIADIGTGSGIIITSVANKTRNSHLFGVDISSKALHIAKHNFHKNHHNHSQYRNCSFIQLDLLDSFDENIEDVCVELGESPNILFLANLPYIKGGDWRNMSPDTRYEPELALFGGDETGFEMYERLFAQIAQILIQGNHNTVKLMIEFGFDQREIAEKTIQQYGWKYEFFADYAGIERFAEIKIPTVR